jgi:hypothetical protein
MAQYARLVARERTQSSQLTPEKRAGFIGIVPNNSESIYLKESERTERRVYSVRSALTGSRLIARRAGI